ncbi:MAG: transketolase [Candidatus Magnetoglobus multicellularis str. Araruama]|uniref:Transketolase n=1 Tax=Candidatus Magnetoglobus multicellularis str. Araruama TaxID=890399 RepID=A0A1V1PA86_9BACT|nr:MAG: transketolase [Candidatus Magnetoglobus multicellularis str. Araruama]
MKTIQAGSQIGDIPDCSIPGIEINGGSLGHGLGIGAGMALGLRAKKNPAIVVVIMGDGELYEGAVWESIMFAGHHQLNNLFLILDNNQMSMLDYCKNTIDLEPLEKKFEMFQWNTVRVDGHDINALLPVLRSMKHHTACKPKAIIAETVKGKGVKQLEGNPLCHIISLPHDDVDNYLMST